LHWHQSHENYAQAKWKVLANLACTPGAVAVLNATDDEVRAKVREIKAVVGAQRGYDYVPIGTAKGTQFDMRQACGAKNAAFVNEQGALEVNVGAAHAELCRVADMQLKGAHNVENALAAASCAVALGAPAAQVALALAAFGALEHRIEPCGTVAGVDYYNDSKATNTDATLKAIAAFDPARPIILLGGRDKGTDLAPLVAACEEHARAVVLFGEAHARFAQAFEGASLEVLHAQNMREALETARAFAQAGDIVVLSPACASFDEFSCFEQRGDVFKRLVAEM
jgi:UDP-N-acetylmuramoylalanine--D-glutamate ligase